MGGTLLVTVVALSLVLLWVAVAWQGFALVEAVQQIAELRSRLDMDNRPTAVDLAGNRERPLGSIGPVLADIELSTHGVDFLVVLTTECTTCLLVAEGLGSLGDEDGARVIPVIETRSSARGAMFIATLGLGERAVVDTDASLLANGIESRPLAIRVVDGRLADAAIVRNGTQLRMFIAEPAYAAARIEVGLAH